VEHSDAVKVRVELCRAKTQSIIAKMANRATPCKFFEIADGSMESI
jgi:hypothetical protein